MTGVAQVILQNKPTAINLFFTTVAIRVCREMPFIAVLIYVIKAAETLNKGC